MHEQLAAVLAALEKLAVVMSRCRSRYGWVPFMAATGLSHQTLRRWCNGDIFQSGKIAEVFESVTWHRR